MTKIPFKTLILSALFFALHLSVSGQNSKHTIAAKTLNAGKTGVIVVGRSAKIGYRATRFVAGKVVKPIIVGSAPKVARFTIRQSGNVVRRSFPVGKMLFIKYLQFRFSP